MEITPLRLYLLAGMLAHKLLWELLKRRAEVQSRVLSPGLIAIKSVKLAVLLGILVQTLTPEVLPITADPRALHIAGAAIYTLGLLTAVTARLQLGDNWSDIEVGRVRADHALVRSGIYRYVRHPIYAGDLALLLGLELALNSWLVLGVVALAVAVYRRAVQEERGLIESVPGYDGYCRESKRFIPFIL